MRTQDHPYGGVSFWRNLRTRKLDLQKEECRITTPFQTGDRQNHG